MIPCQRHLFDLPDEVAYFNCAYLSPLLKSVQEAGIEGVRRKARPWEILTPDFDTEVETARTLFAQLIGAAADDIAAIPAASYGTANAAANLPVAGGERLLVLEDQFPSNVNPWVRLAQRRNAELVTIPRPLAGGWTAPILAAIDERCAIVALPNCHWTDGTLIDLVAVGRRCREAGAALVLDLTQSIGAMPFDVAEVEPDFMVAAGYKWMMGPYSLGFMYAAPKHHDGEGLEHNWASRASDPDFQRLAHYAPRFGLAARRYDVGEAGNFALMPMAVEALRQLIEWGPAETQATLKAMTEAVTARAETIGLVASAPEERAGHFLGLRFPEGPPDDLVARLAKDDVYVSQRGDSMRITPHLYNNEADIGRLFEALETLLDGSD